MTQQPHIELSDLGFPYIPSPVLLTPNGVPYLKHSGVALISKPQVDLSGMKDYLEGYDKELEFPLYLEDPDELPPAEELAKAAGQLCYQSFGPKRTHNSGGAGYLDHIKSSGHGSVFEHANFSLLFYGIDRSVTHELVRHRAGMAYSQVSQRYVAGKTLRFVQRPEYQNDEELEERFIRRIEYAAREYDEIAQILLSRQKTGTSLLSGDAKTELRKKVNQAARSVLPNETEAPIIVTGNGRSWRHVLEMRAAAPAEVLIRGLGMHIFHCLAHAAPLLYQDYKVITLEDGTQAVETKYRKV